MEFAINKKTGVVIVWNEALKDDEDIEKIPASEAYKRLGIPVMPEVSKEEKKKK